MFESPKEKKIEIVESADERERRLMTEALDRLITVDKKLFREGLSTRVLNSDVFCLAGIVLALYWFGFLSCGLLVYLMR